MVRAGARARARRLAETAAVVVEMAVVVTRRLAVGAAVLAGAVGGGL
jgi:hypothetical protein